MNLEFTGERVVPNQVDVNLWNEHKARYAFAARLADNRRVLDAGCGTGYGAAELSAFARGAVGVDVAPEAVAYARAHYRDPKLSWLQASCTDLPFASESFDLVVAFEVIEHLADWPKLVAEAARLLTPEGLFIVSTPNKNFYTESRADSGPNPYHTHEFEYQEFADALRVSFPHVSLYLEDHTEGILFRSVQEDAGAEVRIDSAAAPPEESNFFVAICSANPQAFPASFAYIPTAANLLKERGIHIQRLEEELATKNAWLADARREHQELVEFFRKQKEDLEASNRWAASLLDTQRQYQSRIEELEADLAQKVQWALDTVAELRQCAGLLTEAEKTVEERTHWALQLQQERDELAARLSLAQASRWVRLGRAIGVGPELRNS